MLIVFIKKKKKKGLPILLLRDTCQYLETNFTSRKKANVLLAAVGKRPEKL